MNRLKIRDPRMNLFLENARRARSFIDYFIDYVVGFCRMPGRAATQLVRSAIKTCFIFFATGC
ncbi:hypothetical protein [Burkholderia sola]